MAFTTHMKHRPVMIGGNPIAEWGTWEEAAAQLKARGLAGYMHGIFVMHPGVTIEKETYYT